MPKKKKVTASVNLNRFKTILYFSFLLVLATLSVLNFSIYINNKPQIILAESIGDKEDKQVVFWKSFLEIHPDYFDGWIELSKLELFAGNIDKANFALKRAKDINPNSAEILMLEDKLR